MEQPVYVKKEKSTKCVSSFPALRVDKYWLFAGMLSWKFKKPLITVFNLVLYYHTFLSTTRHKVHDWTVWKIKEVSTSCEKYFKFLANFILNTQALCTLAFLFPSSFYRCAVPPSSQSWNMGYMHSGQTFSFQFHMFYCRKQTTFT